LGWAEHAVHTDKMSNTNFRPKKGQGKKLLEKRMHEWEDNIKVDFGEIGFRLDLAGL
jgi:hypothetical protein